MAAQNGDSLIVEPANILEVEVAEEVKILEENEIPLTPDSAAEEARKAEIYRQIVKIEEEIVTLNQAMERKERQLADLKQELGITPWSQLRDSLTDRYHYLQTTSAYQKTSDTLKDWNDKVVHSNTYNKLSVGALATKSVLSDAGQKTASAAKSMGSVTAKKLGEIRDSSYMQSFGSKMKSASSSIRERVVGQRSVSESDAFEDNEARAENLDSTAKKDDLTA